MEQNQTQKPRLLVLLSRVPYPLDKGDKLRAYHQIRGLSKNFRIILVCLNTGKVDTRVYQLLNPFCENIHVIQLNPLAIAWRLLLNVGTNRPFQVAYFHSKQAQKELDAIIEKYLPQRFYCQLVRVSEYARKYTIFSKSLDYMDALSLGMERRLTTSNAFIRPLVREEARRLKSYESTVFNDFEEKVIISEEDQNHIQHPNHEEIKVIPNGISEMFFSKYDIKKDYDLCFTGNMSYAPNVKGAVYIAKKILPQLGSEKPVKVLISGKSPSISVKRLNGKQITVSGWVDDMRESYYRSKVFVAPMIIGSGLQNKLLEAMACGIPCVTTSLANKALGATHGENIFIADTPEEFAAHIQTLLNDKELRKTIGKAGKNYVRENFSWEIWNEKLVELM